MPYEAIAYPPRGIRGRYFARSRGACGLFADRARTPASDGDGGICCVKLSNRPYLYKHIAAQTAQYLTDATGVPVRSKPDLMEVNNGQLAGLSYEEADEKYPRIPDLPSDKSVYGMESKVEFRARAERIHQKILSETSESDTVAVVTHGGMINQLYHVFLNLPVANDLFFSTSDTGIHEWIITPNGRRIARSNYDAYTNGI